MTTGELLYGLCLMLVLPFTWLCVWIYGRVEDMMWKNSKQYQRHKEFQRRMRQQEFEENMEIIADMIEYESQPRFKKEWLRRKK